MQPQLHDGHGRREELLTHVFRRDDGDDPVARSDLPGRRGLELSSGSQSRHWVESWVHARTAGYKVQT